MSDDTLLIILGNQLFDKKYLSEAKTKNIFMAEDFGLCTEEKYHKQKLFFFLCAMRSFRDEMSKKGYKVFYNQLNQNIVLAPHCQVEHSEAYRALPEQHQTDYFE